MMPNLAFQHQKWSGWATAVGLEPVIQGRPGISTQSSVAQSMASSIKSKVKFLPQVMALRAQALAVLLVILQLSVLVHEAVHFCDDTENVNQHVCSLGHSVYWDGAVSRQTVMWPIRVTAFFAPVPKMVQARAQALGRLSPPATGPPAFARAELD